MSSSHIIETSDATFKADTLDSSIPVVVDFWAPWCGPCRMLSPVFEALAEEYAGRVKFGKVNVDDNTNTVGHYGIMAIPTILFIKDGKVVDQLVGAITKDRVILHLEKILKD